MPKIRVIYILQVLIYSLEYILCNLDNSYSVQDGGNVVLNCPSKEEDNYFNDFNEYLEGRYKRSNANAATYILWNTPISTIIATNDTIQTQTGIFNDHPEHYSLLRNGSLSIINATPEFTDTYSCSIHFGGETYRQRSGDVCLDVMRDGYGRLCLKKVEPNNTQVPGESLEKKYIILITCLGVGVLIVIGVIILVKYVVDRRDIHRPPTWVESDAYGTKNLDHGSEEIYSTIADG